VQGSVGIAVGTGEQTTNELMRSADLAMYRAKGEGKGRYALFEPSMHEGVLERLGLKADLQRALGAEEFEIYYQPIVELGSGAIAGVEALLRWRHPERGLVPPEEFIGLADETGLILPVGRFVLHTACAQVTHWRSVGHVNLGVSVNISARQLFSSHLPGDIAAALAEASLDPAALTLEISETMLLDNREVSGRLEAVKALGVRIAIDDFGTSVLSLSHIRRCSVDTLKIAGAFVEDVGSSAEQDRLVAAILRLVPLGLETVAEGIGAGAAPLASPRLPLWPGYLFSHPAGHELDSAQARASRSVKFRGPRAGRLMRRPANFATLCRDACRPRSALPRPDPSIEGGAALIGRRRPKCGCVRSPRGSRHARARASCVDSALARSSPRSDALRTPAE
jgi:predicted signal transduction protein with EAL and GGDEF domain